MKSIYINILLISFCLASCLDKEEVIPRERVYPIIKTLEATEIDTTGVSIHAGIVYQGTEPIIDYGFFWQNKKKEISDREFESEISLGANCNCETFSYRITNDLDDGTLYLFKPYIKTESFTVLGEELSFESLGTKYPVIDSLSSEEGFRDDIITIYGKNFSEIKNRVQVYFGRTSLYILSAGKDSINVRVPEYDEPIATTIKLIIGKREIFFPRKFKFATPEIYDISPKAGFREETEFVITGKNFTRNGAYASILIGNNRIYPLSYSANKLTFKIPHYYEVGKYDIQIQFGNKYSEKLVDGFEIKTRWKQLATFPGGNRYSFKKYLIGDKVYIIGGGTSTSNSSATNEVWVYDITNNSWTQKKDFPGEARYYASGFVINGEIYYGFGKPVGNTITDFWKYDINNDSWEEVQSGSHYLESSEFGYELNGKGYILEKYTYNLREYDPVLNVWSENDSIKPSENLRWNPQGLLKIENELFIINLYQHSFFRFDINSQQFSLPTYFPNGSVGDYEEIAMEIGGILYTYSSRSVKTYDIDLNKWVTKESNLNINFSDGFSLGYDGKVFVGLGIKGSNGEPGELWMFDPKIE